MSELFYDCGAYGLFTLASEKWQPTYRGKCSDPDKFLANPSASLRDNIWKELGAVIEVLGNDLRVIDVGGYIGTFTIPLAIEARRHGIDLTFDVYEPGPTRGVLAKNIALNGLSDRVTLWDAAVARASGVIKYNWREDGAIGGHVMQGGPTLQSRQVDAVTIDQFIGDLDRPFLIKLDTQGYEPNIMHSARMVMERRKTVWRIEYIKWSALSKFDGGTFAEYLLSQFYCFEDKREISAETMPGFLDEIDARPARMADLLLIPRDGPFTEQLLAAVR